MKAKFGKVGILALTMILFFGQPGLSENLRPENFVDLGKAVPSLVLDIRYFGDHNFLGTRVDGYLAPKCILTAPAAEALARVQAELQPFSLSLMIYDCYRPQQAVDHFVRWAKDIGDTKTREEFYPTLEKSALFRDGYVAEKSSHSRGSTVDLTIVPIPMQSQEQYVPGQPLRACFRPAAERFMDGGIDMGTGFDCFHELSHPENGDVEVQQRVNRLLLKTLMDKHGFNHYDQEWWHFTLRNEPYPDTYFNFPVE